MFGFVMNVEDGEMCVCGYELTVCGFSAAQIPLHLNIYVAEAMAQTSMCMCAIIEYHAFFCHCQKGHFKPNSRPGDLFDSCCC